MSWTYLYLEFSTQHWWLLPFSSHLLNCKDFISIECFVPFWYVHIWLFLVTKLPKYFISSRLSCLANRKHCTENHATYNSFMGSFLEFIFSKFFLAWSKVGRIVKSVNSAIYWLFRTRLKKIEQRNKINKIWRK